MEHAHEFLVEDLRRLSVNLTPIYHLIEPLAENGYITPSSPPPEETERYENWWELTEKALDVMRNPEKYAYRITLEAIRNIVQGRSRLPEAYVSDLAHQGIFTLGMESKPIQGGVMYTRTYTLAPGIAAELRALD